MDESPFQGSLLINLRLTSQSALVLNGRIGSTEKQSTVSSYFFFYPGLCLLNIWKGLDEDVFILNSRKDASFLS